MQEVDTGLSPPQSFDYRGAASPDCSLTQDLRQLATEAKALAQTEFAYQKSRAAFVASETRTIAILLVAALMVVWFAAMAIVIGTVIALGPVLGAWGAMAVVTVALVVLAAGCGLSARSRLQRMMKIAGNGTEA